MSDICKRHKTATIKITPKFYEGHCRF